MSVLLLAPVELVKRLVLVEVETEVNETVLLEKKLVEPADVDELEISEVLVLARELSDVVEEKGLVDVVSEVELAVVIIFDVELDKRALVVEVLSVELGKVGIWVDEAVVSALVLELETE